MIDIILKYNKKYCSILRLIRIKGITIMMNWVYVIKMIKL